MARSEIQDLIVDALVDKVGASMPPGAEPADVVGTVLSMLAATLEVAYQAGEISFEHSCVTYAAQAVRLFDQRVR